MLFQYEWIVADFHGELMFGMETVSIFPASKSRGRDLEFTMGADTTAYMLERMTTSNYLINALCN